MTGEERIIYYRHEIAVMVVAALLLWLLRQPLLPYLDVTILGIGMFLTCGRMGCFMVGCCHGRPHDWGVCYRAMLLPVLRLIMLVCGSFPFKP